MTREISREEILAMPAGRELDKLVAEKVMGYEFETKFQQLFNPSESISAAWEVVEKLREQQLFVDTRTCSDFYEVWVTRWGVDPEQPASTETVAHPSLPLAICRAALLTTMEETP